MKICQDCKHFGHPSLSWDAYCKQKVSITSVIGSRNIQSVGENGDENESH